MVSERNGKPDLWSMRMENGSPTGPLEFVQNNVDRLLGAAPNGHYYYYLQTHVTDHYLTDLDPVTGLPVSKPRQITSQGDNFGATWSPDGQWLAGYGWRKIPGSGIHTLTIHSSKTGEARELDLKEPLEFSDTSYQSPLWFPDSRTLLCHGPYTGKLRRLDIRTAQFQALPDAAKVPTYRDGGGSPQSVVLSPDGGSIYYMVRDSAAGETRFVRRALEGGPETEVTRLQARAVSGFAISPDGERLAIAAARRGNSFAIWTASTSGGAPQEFFNAQAKWSHHPRWSKDGRHLFVYLGPNIYVLPAGGGEPKLLEFSMPQQGGTLDIRPDGKQLVFSHGQFDNQLWVLKNLFGEAEPKAPR